MDETDVEMVVPDAGGETLLHHAAFHGKVYVLCPHVLETSLTMSSTGAHSGVVA